ncbi:MAG: ATP-binding protein [bacterium]
MMMTKIEENAQLIEKDMQWLHTIIINRIKDYLEGGKETYQESDPFDISDINTFYSTFVKSHDLTQDERKVVLLALAPEIKPELLDEFLIRNRTFDKTFTEFGGMNLHNFNGFLPTLKTAYFLLAGHQISSQMKYARLFDKTNKLLKENILRQLKSDEGNPATNKLLCLSDSALSYIMTGEDIHYEYSVDFPARQLTTLMEWEDLVLCESTHFNLKELLAWPEHGKKFIEELNMGKNIQAGYRALFYGPPGTGKTLTAALIGKKVEKPVYRIDLSQLVSKYIGETEKNLEKIFNSAENHDWILFFDEADALFGKRTKIGSSNDRFANQETAYLLQRIEMCSNMVILATNLKGNLDKAFTRRFQSIVFFPMPTEEERLRIWQGAFTDRVVLDDAIDLKEIAKKYDIAGGSIVNVVRYATLMAVSNNMVYITYNDLIDGIKREYTKLGRTL